MWGGYFRPIFLGQNVNDSHSHNDSDSHLENFYFFFCTDSAVPTRFDEAAGAKQCSTEAI